VQMRSASLDGAAAVFLVDQARRTAAEFGKMLPRARPVLEWGDVAEYRAATAELSARILISRDEPNWWRIRYQIAHEVFHWLCSPPPTFHWTHELLAVETAIRAMEEIGELDYARREMERLSGDADRLSLDEMLRASLAAGYPEGLYGRAWVTGRQLIDAVGWESVKLVAKSAGEARVSRLEGWFSALPRESRPRAESILGLPSAEWV
jgi:hypothetical protein